MAIDAHCFHGYVISSPEDGVNRTDRGVITMYFLIDQSALIFIAASLAAITLGTGLNHNSKL